MVEVSRWRLWRIEYAAADTQNGKLPRKYPEEAEVLTASDFDRCGTKPSVFAPGRLVEDVSQRQMVCPACDEPGPQLGHADYAQCPCGLEMQRFGNALYIWRARNAPGDAQEGRG